MFCMLGVRIVGFVELLDFLWFSTWAHSSKIVEFVELLDFLRLFACWMSELLDLSNGWISYGFLYGRNNDRSPFQNNKHNLEHFKEKN